MADALTTFYEKQFEKNWELLDQQMDSRLKGTVQTDSFIGKRKQYNQLATRTMKEVTTRKDDTPDGDSEGSKYWIFRRKFEDVIVYDEDDQLNLGEISLPDSDEVAQMSASSNRVADQVIISAFDGTRYIGENGTTTSNFDTNMSIAVNYVPSGSPANSGITVAKILQAKKLLDENEVPQGDRYFAVSAQQLQDMLLRTEITSADYVAVKGLVDGSVDRFAGFKFVHTELLSLNAGTDVRTCFAWHKSGIKFAEIGRSVHIDMLPSRRHAKQIRYVYRCGAVRTQDTRIVRIYADESP